MLFQPTNITPSTLSGVGNGVIDTTDGLNVSWQVNGNSPLLAFQIEVYAVDATSTLLYTTGKLADNCPFVGTSYNGEVIYFQYLIVESILTGANIVNGNQYKFIVTQWWGSTDTESVRQTSASVFVTRNKPVLTINPIPNPVTTSKLSFTAQYTQIQNDTLTFVEWELIETLNPDVILAYQKVYGTPELRLDYDGFFTGKQYSIRCAIQTSTGDSAETDWTTFNVLYQTVDIDGIVTAVSNCRESAVELNWSAIQYIPGVAYGLYEIKNGILYLPYGSEIIWNEVNEQSMNFETPWTLFWHGQLNPSGVNIDFIELSNTLTVRLTADNKLTFYVRGVLYYTYDEVIITSNGTLTIIVSADTIAIRYTYPIGGLYPRTDLYPSTTLFPKANSEIVINVTTVSVNLPLTNINAVILNGEQICDYIWIKKFVSSSEINQLIRQDSIQPFFDDNTYFLANFENELHGGNLISEGNLVGFAIYRKSSLESILRLVANIPIGETSILDYSATSQTSYEYYVYTESDTSYISSPFISDEITPIFWDWSILECVETAENTFVVENVYLFGKNLSSGSVGNNNTPTINKTFTPYPNVQKNVSSYRSGVLTSLIGTINYTDENSKIGYSDTNELRDAIYDLCVTTNTLFLKNRRGDIIKISTNGAISMSTMDNTRVQAQTVNLPWVEVGSSEGVSITNKTT